MDNNSDILFRFFVTDFLVSDNVCFFIGFEVMDEFGINFMEFFFFFDFYWFFFFNRFLVLFILFVIFLFRFSFVFFNLNNRKKI